MAKGIIRRDPAMAERALKSLLFWISSFFMSGSTVMIALAPYDPAIFWWKHLSAKNSVIYHTSWPYWINDDQPEKPLFFKGFFLRLWKGFVESQNVRTVCVLEKTKKEIEKKFAAVKNRPSVIPHSIDRAVFYPGRRGKSRHIKVLYAGRLEFQKGLFYLAEAMTRLKDSGIMFGICGSGKHKQMLKAVLSMPHVRDHGQAKDRKTMAAVMRQYDVLVVPSFKTKNWEELFGMVVIEAMACGLAVVATDCVGPKSIIRHMKNGLLIRQKDTGAIVSALSILDRDRRLALKLAKGGLKTAAAYDVKRVSGLWEGLLYA